MKEAFNNFSTLLDMSDYISDEKEKQNLLSYGRYKKCHRNAQRVIHLLNEKDKKNAYVVSGTINANEQDRCYHSWIEIEDKNIVLDYNHALC